MMNSVGLFDEDICQAVRVDALELSSAVPPAGAAAASELIAE